VATDDTSAEDTASASLDTGAATASADASAAPVRTTSVVESEFVLVEADEFHDAMEVSV
jgi:hypothetical protein